MDKTSSALAEGSGAVSRKVADAASSVAGSAYAASGKAAEMTIAAVGGLQTRFKKALGATAPIADKLPVTTQGLLASSLSDDLNRWLQVSRLRIGPTLRRPRPRTPREMALRAFASGFLSLYEPNCSE